MKNLIFIALLLAGCTAPPHATDPLTTSMAQTREEILLCKTWQATSIIARGRGIFIDSYGNNIAQTFNKNGTCRLVGQVSSYSVILTGKWKIENGMLKYSDITASSSYGSSVIADCTIIELTETSLTLYGTDGSKQIYKPI